MFSSINTKGLIQKHGYEVIASTNDNPDNPHVTVLFPERKQRPFFNSFLIAYRPQKTEGAYGIEIESSDVGRDFLPCNKYAVEIVVFSDIFKLCELIRYNRSLVSYHVLEREVGLDEFRKNLEKSVCLSRSDKSKKNKLERLIEEAKNNHFAPEEFYIERSIKEGFLEDYMLLKKIIEQNLNTYE